MKILIVHNYYQILGGEDAVFKNEEELLYQHGNIVTSYTVDNEDITSFLKKVKIAFSALFSRTSYKTLKKALIQHQPDVVHVHNYFPILSPSTFYACKKIGVPVVHTLHNYRAVCPTALLMHGGKIEERSINHSSWWAVKKRVYRNSFLGSLSLTAMVETHKKLGTWQTKVDRFIALTEFSKSKYIEAGWPENKIVVKPNFIEDPFDGIKKVKKAGGYALFVGRLSQEKGIEVLFDAWADTQLPLKVIGDGPLKDYVETHSKGNIEYLGLKDKTEVLRLIQNSDFIIMPSIWYETFGMVIIEAFSCGTPVICSRLGSLETIVKNNFTGLHFKAGNPADLADKVQWMIENPKRAQEMACSARQEYLDKYTPGKNYKMLMDIYQQALEEAKSA